MKSRSWCPLGLTGALLLAAAVPAMAQEVGDESDHEALRGLRAAFEEAVNCNAMERMAPYIATNFSVVTFTDREFTDFESFKAQWLVTRERMLKGGTYTLKMIPERSQILGDLAIARGDSEHEMVTGDGKHFSFTAHWTVICRKVDGQWKIVRAHNSLDPFGNPMLKSAVKSMLIKAVFCSAAVGLLLGTVLGAWRGRRSRSR